MLEVQAKIRVTLPPYPVYVSSIYVILIHIVIAFVVFVFPTLVISLSCLFFHISGTTARNPIDRIFRRWTMSTNCGRIREDRRGFFTECLRCVILDFSDRRLVTGLAVIIVGVVKLTTGQTTVCHFTNVMDLARFSPNTHMLSLLVLRTHSRRRVDKP